MGKLTIDEVIGHCERTVERYEKQTSRAVLEKRPLEEIFIKEYWEHRQVAEWLEELQAFKDKQEQGLLIEPKCRVGGYVYYPVVDYNYIFPVRISQIIISDVGNGKSVFQYNGITFDGNGDAYEEYEFDDNDFGVRVFLTESEAEEALARMKGE